MAPTIKQEKGENNTESVVYVELSEDHMTASIACEEVASETEIHKQKLRGQNYSLKRKKSMSQHKVNSADKCRTIKYEGNKTPNPVKGKKKSTMICLSDSSEMIEVDMIDNLEGCFDDDENEQMEEEEEITDNNTVREYEPLTTLDNRETYL